MLAAGGLSGCRQPMTRDYLLTHPDALKREITRCHSVEAQNESMVRQCEMVMSVMNEFIGLLSELKDNPEAFGKRIISAEQDCVVSKERYDEAVKRVQALRRVRVGGDELAQAIELEKTTHLDYSKKHLTVKKLLTALGINTPE